MMTPLPTILDAAHVYRRLLHWRALGMTARELQVFLDVTADGAYGPRTRAAHRQQLDGAWQRLCAEVGWEWMPTATTHGDGITAPSRIILHWPVAPITAAGVAEHWRGREVGSHLQIDEARVIWTAAPHTRTNHARGHNADSLGVDVCVPVLARDAERARARGIHAGLDASGKYLLLAPSVADRVALTVQAACAILDVVPGLDWTAGGRVTDHAAVDPARKIDCIVWRAELQRAWVTK
jgi:hypothetical protein